VTSSPSDRDPIFLTLLIVIVSVLAFETEPVQHRWQLDLVGWKPLRYDGNPLGARVRTKQPQRLAQSQGDRSGTNP
jgi:hypothetical protein